MLDNITLWEKVLTEIELSVSKANFSTWFKHTYILKQESGIIYLAVPNEFIKDWLNRKYHKAILRILRNASGNIRSIEYLISQEKPKEMTREERVAVTHNTELPLNDLYINKEDNLNPRYTFENLIVGSFNNLAHAAAQAVTKNPGTTYNPLFIYGDTGLGKTHITQAIGNHIKNVSPNKKVHYITSEEFVVNLVNAIETNKGNLFKEKYRKYDVLIIDDIQFISGKDKSQEELFHLFNTLYENNKQIIFSSDVHPNHMPGLEDRLKSRFSAGMIVDMTLPEYESRVAIVKHKAKINDYPLNEEIIDHLATTLHSNIREIEGIVNTVICQARLKNRNLTKEELETLIKNTTKQKKKLSVNEVVNIVSRFYNIEERAIYEKSRKKEVVRPRQVIMYLLREDMGESFPTIGEKLGGRDHTTVIHSCDKIRNDLKSNGVLSREIDQLRSLFK